jgi:hypothetical protein
MSVHTQPKFVKSKRKFDKNLVLSYKIYIYLRKYTVINTKLPFGVLQSRRPNELVHTISLSGKFSVNNVTGKTYHPNNILCRFGKPMFSFEATVKSQNLIPNTWSIIIRYNPTITPQFALRDFNLWLEGIIETY